MEELMYCLIGLVVTYSVLNIIVGLVFSIEAFVAHDSCSKTMVKITRKRRLSLIFLPALILSFFFSLILAPLYLLPRIFK